MVLQKHQLDAYVGKSMAEICPNGFAGADRNHCAHFVSHALGYDFGLTCRQMVKEPAGAGACLRVQDLFERCPEVGLWADLPNRVPACLAFVTDMKNVDLQRKRMTNVPRKHVGIYFGGTIWHHSRLHGGIVTRTPKEFARHYSGKTITLYYGLLPEQ
jgi:hypothetical protein